MSLDSFGSSSLIETELFRGKLYEGILQNLYALKLVKGDGKLLPITKINYLLLRYVFNKIADSSSEPEIQDGKNSDVKIQKPIYDPVFITRVSSLAINQLQDDFKYFGITKPFAKDVSNMIENKFVEAINKLQTQKILKDGFVALTGINIMYGSRIYPDISSLGKNNPKYLKQALALQVRYKYMHLETYGLSNSYANMGYKPSDKVIEGFGSAFNHYFNVYHSAFPDLEACFGSRGSFFDAPISPDWLTICNPPFDASVMKCMIVKVLKMLQISSDNKKCQSFMLTLPDWNDMKEITDLKNNKFCVEYKQIPKNNTSFIDSNTGTIIKPCSILQILLQTNEK